MLDSRHGPATVTRYEDWEQKQALRVARQASGADVRRQRKDRADHGRRPPDVVRDLREQAARSATVCAEEALGSVHLDSKLRAEISEIANTLQGNLDKVVQHGKRADAIVKNMLLHSRQGSGRR
jgi:hypothetical protein